MGAKEINPSQKQVDESEELGSSKIKGIDVGQVNTNCYNGPNLNEPISSDSFSPHRKAHSHRTVAHLVLKILAAFLSTLKIICP